MKGLEHLHDGADVETVLEEVVAARRVGTDAKDLFGGPRDWIDASVPTAAFGIAVGIFGASLGTALKVAIAAEVVIVAVRLVKRETLRHAFSGAFGVAIAALLARAMHSKGAFFLPGIFINAAYAVGFLVSVLIGHPLVGVILRLVWEKPKEWHEHPKVRRAYTEATLGWAAMFAVRAIVQETLRRLGLIGWLAVAKIAMGYPLYLGVLALTLPYVKRRTADVPVPEPEPVEEEPAAVAAEPEAP